MTNDEFRNFMIDEYKTMNAHLAMIEKYLRNLDAHADKILTDTSVLKESVLKSEEYMQKTENNTFTTHTDIVRYTNLVKRGDDTL